MVCLRVKPFGRIEGIRENKGNKESEERTRRGIRIRCTYYIAGQAIGGRLPFGDRSATVRRSAIM